MTIKLSATKLNETMQMRMDFLGKLYKKHEQGIASVKISLNDLKTTLSGLSLNDLYWLIDKNYIVVISNNSTELQIRLSGSGVNYLERG